MILSTLMNIIVSDENPVTFCLSVGATALWILSYIVLFAEKWGKYSRLCRADVSYMMVHHVVGNATNLIGAMLANQSDIQIMFALVLVILDALQFIFCFVFKLVYKCRYNSPVFNFEVFRLTKSTTNTTAKRGRMTRMLVPWLVVCNVWLCYNMADTRPPDTGHWKSRILLQYNPQDETSSLYESVGYTIGIISAMFYVTGILPTTLKVFQEKALSGLFVAFLAISSMGNFLYVSVILLNHPGVEFFFHVLPWSLPRVFLCFANIAIIAQSSLNTNTHHAARPVRDEVVSLLQNDGEAADYHYTDDETDSDDNTIFKCTDFEDSDHIDHLCEVYVSACYGEGLPERLPNTPVHNMSLDSLDRVSDDEELTEEQVYDILANEDFHRYSKVSGESADLTAYDSQPLKPLSYTGDREYGQTFTIASQNMQKELQWQYTPSCIVPTDTAQETITIAQTPMRNSDRRRTNLASVSSDISDQHWFTVGDLPCN